MTREKRSEFKIISSANLAITSNTTTNGFIHDLADTRSNFFSVNVANYTDGTYTFEFFESDDSGMAGEVAIDDVKLQGTEAGLTISGAIAQGVQLGSIAVVSTLRFVRVKVTSTGTTTGADIIVELKQEPTITPAEGLSA